MVTSLHMMPNVLLMNDMNECLNCSQMCFTLSLVMNNVNILLTSHDNQLVFCFTILCHTAWDKKGKWFYINKIKQYQIWSYLLFMVYAFVLFLCDQFNASAVAIINVLGTTLFLTQLEKLLCGCMFLVGIYCIISKGSPTIISMYPSYPHPDRSALHSTICYL